MSSKAFAATFLPALLLLSIGLVSCEPPPQKKELSSAPLDAKEIKGAFGLSLGQDIASVSKIQKVSNGLVPSEWPIFEISVPEPTEKFKSYYGIASPQGKLVAILGKMPYKEHVSSMRIYEDFKKKFDESYGAVQQKPIPPIYLGSEYLYKGKRIQLKITTNVAYGKELVVVYAYAPGSPENPPKVLP